MDESSKREEFDLIDRKVLTKSQVIRKIIRNYISGKILDEEYKLLCDEWVEEIIKNRI